MYSTEQIESQVTDYATRRALSMRCAMHETKGAAARLAEQQRLALDEQFRVNASDEPSDKRPKLRFTSVFCMPLTIQSPIFMNFVGSLKASKC